MASNVGLLEMFAGEDRVIDFTVTGTDPSAATEITFRLTDGPKVTTLNGGTALTLTVGSGIAAPDSTSILVTLAEADTSALGCVRGYFELRLDDSSGLEQVIADGILNIKPSNSN
jgi:hypothetical protein